MVPKTEAPDAVAAAPGARVVIFGKLTTPLTATDVRSQFAKTWLIERHHVRPELAGFIAEAACLGDQP